jgi:hypothetical protein
METLYWTMSNGQQIEIDKMDRNHLVNTLKMIVRHNNKIIAQRTALKREFTINGDMAQEFNNSFHSKPL